jgi:hypothetical protein
MRLINRIPSAQGDGLQISVFFSQPFSAAQRRRILDALGPDAPPVNLIGGLVGLASYLGEAFIDACI